MGYVLPLYRWATCYLSKDELRVTFLRMGLVLPFYQIRSNLIIRPWLWNLTTKVWTEHCVKSVQIRSYFWSVFSCIQSEYRKIWTRNNSVFRHFSCSGTYNKSAIYQTKTHTPSTLGLNWTYIRRSRRLL